MVDVAVKGRSRAKARELLQAAEDKGLDPRLVRTTSTGYLVPEELVSDTGSSEDQGTASDDPDTNAGPAEQYDPDEHNAPEVVKHLKSLDDQEEIDRILATEEAGQARKGVLQYKEENR